METSETLRSYHCWLQHKLTQKKLYVTQQTQLTDVLISHPYKQERMMPKHQCFVYIN